MKMCIALLAGTMLLGAAIAQADGPRTEPIARPRAGDPLPKDYQNTLWYRQWSTAPFRSGTDIVLDFRQPGPWSDGRHDRWPRDGDRWGERGRDGRRRDDDGRHVWSTPRYCPPAYPAYPWSTPGWYHYERTTTLWYLYPYGYSYRYYYGPVAPSFGWGSTGGFYITPGGYYFYLNIR